MLRTVVVDVTAAQGSHLSISLGMSSQGDGTTGTWTGCAGGLARAGSDNKAPVFAKALPPWSTSVSLASVCEPPGELTAQTFS